MVSLDYLFPPNDEKPLYARDGWLIPTETITESPVDLTGIRTISNDYLKRLPQGNRIRSYSSYAYNCVGMIFAARRRWIEIDHIYDILRHDGYRQIRKEDAITGDVILYKQANSVTHVALIVQIERIGSEMNVKVLSKWGSLAEYEHFAEDVITSVTGIPSEYWTERVL